MSFLSHLRLAWRSLRKAPGLFLAAILILGAGVGVNTALFSLLHAVLLRPLPGVAHSDELIRVRRTLKGQTQGNQSYPDYVDLRDRLTTLAGLAAERVTPMRLTDPAEVVSGTIATGNYFQVIGAAARLGRLLAPEDDAGEHAVVVLSEALWLGRYAGDPAIAGKTVLVNSYPFTVIGVAAAPFRGVQFAEPTSLWIPIGMVKHGMTRSRDYHWLTERRAGWLTYYGRLKPGMRLERVYAELAAVGRRLETLYPDSNTGRGFRATAHADMTPEQRGEMRALFGLLAAAGALVLLIACGNIGNLLLARAAGQTREIAVRMALGAGRRDLLGRPLAEAMLIGLAGGLLAVLLAPWILPALRKLLAAPIPAGVLDGRVLAFHLGLTLIAVLLFGVAPAWFAIRSDAVAALTRDYAGCGRARGKMMCAWVVAQVALSLALVVSGALVLASMRKILAIDPGYRADRVAVAAMDLSLLAYSPQRGTQAFLDLIDRVLRLPGVQSATVAKSSPAVDWSDRVELNGLTADRNIVAPGYFRTLGIPLLAGRDFSLADRGGARPVAIVSQTLANRLWPSGNPIGLYIPMAPQPVEVIGVAADTRYRSVLDAPPALLYSPLLQNYDSIGRLMIAVDGPPAKFHDALRRAVRQADPDLPLARFVSLQDQIDASLWQRRAAASLLSLFGVLAVGLACAGIYGVVAYTTAQQTRDIAIRMALGAGRRGVVTDVLRRTVKLVGIGVAMGMPLAVWVTPGLANLLYGMRRVEPLAFLLVSLIFFAVALAAAAIPARKAATVDPVLALRSAGD